MWNEKPGFAPLVADSDMDCNNNFCVFAARPEVPDLKADFRTVVPTPLWCDGVKLRLHAWLIARWLFSKGRSSDCRGGCGQRASFLGLI